jgi:hypothetical protein
VAAVVLEQVLQAVLLQVAVADQQVQQVQVETVGLQTAVALVLLHPLTPLLQNQLHNVAAVL